MPDDFKAAGRSRIAKLLIRLNSYERVLSRVRVDARKKEMRRKIQLGGLVVKSGLDAEEDAVILGALVLAVQALAGEHGEGVREKFKQAGDQVFLNDLGGQ